MKSSPKQLDDRAITAIRMLALDMVERAKSGHPGLPLGAAPMAYTLFRYHLRFNPRNPSWPNRDRFVLSAGHGSALLYSLLHVFGYDLPTPELERFRQWGSKTPGHPEYGETPGVETTTGPLGQGFATAIGFALAERAYSSRFNRPGFPLIDHFTYALVSDGDLMEGVSSEAASMAGTFKLGKLIYLYDRNQISIEGSTDVTFREDVRKRFEAYGWHTETVSDGNDIRAIRSAIDTAKREFKRPSLVIIQTQIGYGCPKQGCATVHGEPLGSENYEKTRQNFEWEAAPFSLPLDVQRGVADYLVSNQHLEDEWRALLNRYRSSFPKEAAEFDQWLAGDLPASWENAIPDFRPTDKPVATRTALGKIMNSTAANLPNLIGGSADLSPSTKTFLNNRGDLGEGNGQNIHFGVREHGMGAAINGMALYGGIIPFCSTFLAFSDYMRPAIRLAALTKCHSIFIFSHDSIGLGEDGPTHQPVEHVMALRLIPGLTVIRPADANETAGAWRWAVANKRPTALILSRQDLPVLSSVPRKVEFGAYVLKDSSPDPEILLIATGSEVHLALAVQAELERQGTLARVVSMPSWELFQAQSQGYRDSVLPPSIIRRVSIEAGVTTGWARWIGDRGTAIGVDRFGASAPGSVVMKELGLSVENIMRRILEIR